MTDQQAVDAAFRCHAVAIRREDDPPIPGEPYVSMATAKELCVKLILGERATIEAQRDALAYLETEARRLADCYKPGSDGRNTFVIFADKIAARLKRRGEG